MYKAVTQRYRLTQQTFEFLHIVLRFFGEIRIRRGKACPQEERVFFHDPSEEKMQLQRLADIKIGLHSFLHSIVIIRMICAAYEICAG